VKHSHVFYIKNYLHSRLWRPGLFDVKDHTLSRQLSYTPAALNSPETLFVSFWYSFLLEAE
jgi:hypothetical protein